jgi:lactate dehydrogenase-like 2-hydroxyacid dehydrogenase
MVRDVGSGRAGAGRPCEWQVSLGVAVVGRRLGIFGMGRIGRELARMARGIGMTIHYRDVTPLPSALEEGAIYHETDAGFLASCDVLSLHAPGGGATYHWLNADRIAMLPRGAVVVNAARGTLVDDTVPVLSDARRRVD